MSFRNKIERSLRWKGSNIVLALDLPPDQPRNLLSHSLEILEKVHNHICAVKINRQLTLPLGLSDGVKKILNLANKEGLPTIMDCKINDVGHTNSIIAEYYFNAGFDAVTVNPFIGWENGLEPVFTVAKKMRRGILLLVYMSHKGAGEGYGQIVRDEKTGRSTSQYVLFAEKALSYNPDGVIVGATYPEKIREVHTILRDQVPIYSPGVGVQGGDLESAIVAGSRYLIIGRSITLAVDPFKTSKEIRNEVEAHLKK